MADGATNEETAAPGAPDFAYRDGELHAEGVRLAAVAASVGTPFYCYSSAAIERRYRRFAAAFAATTPPSRPTTIFYAVKANSNQAVIRLLARLGAGADVVSVGEFRRALAAGIPGSRIVFSGVGKTAEEMAFALEHEVHQINVESLPELELLSEVATRLGRAAPIAVRVNPDVDPHTHAKIATGKKENKFGIDLGDAAAAYRQAASLPGLDPVGVAVHIGSQLLDLAPLEQAFTRLVALARELRDTGIELRRLDLGGGLGINYGRDVPPAIEAYAAMVKRVTGGSDMALGFEPGRWMVGNAGVLVSRVLFVKDGLTKRFIVQDAAMNDLIRPSLYDAWHEIVPVREPVPSAGRAPADIVGPVCESGDYFAADRPFPEVAAGDLLAVLSAGAYGAAMSSSYNTRLPVPEVLVRGTEFAIVRGRPTYDELLRLDSVPQWLADD
jgi:diaminopimelate decarboxylase